jgi:Gly-Xaa carboxypeptidase
MRGLLRDDEPRPRSRLLFFAVLVLSIGGFLLVNPRLTPSHTRTAARDFQRVSVNCPTQHPALAPAITFLPSHDEAVYIQRLQGAVQVRTETFDEAAQAGNDPWYDKFYTFEAYLLATFPDV